MQQVTLQSYDSSGPQPCATHGLLSITPPAIQGGWCSPLFYNDCTKRKCHHGFSVVFSHTGRPQVPMYVRILLTMHVCVFWASNLCYQLVHVCLMVIKIWRAKSGLVYVRFCMSLCCDLVSKAVQLPSRSDRQSCSVLMHVAVVLLCVGQPCTRPWCSI